MRYSILIDRTASPELIACERKCKSIMATEFHFYPNHIFSGNSAVTVA